MLYYYYLLFIGLYVSAFSLPTVEKDVKGDIDPYPNKLVRIKTKEEMSKEKQKDYWNNEALQVLEKKLLKKLNQNTAKNIVFFLGDGMSIPTIAATRVYMGGEEQKLSFEKFPFTGLSKTYCVDHQTADSACSATAYLGGVKANLATIGVSAAVDKKNCTAMNQPENHVHSIAHLFQLKGKRTGLVTTTKVTDASPAGVYAHTAFRRWESDTHVLKSNNDPEICKDIASQLIFGEVGNKLQVILGGGRRMFLPKEVIDEEGHEGERSDNKNLILEYIKQKERLNQTYQYIWNRKQLLNLKNETEYVIGLFDPSDIPYNLERNKELDPSLEEMTEAAIKILQKGTEGFFLFVEGGRIDTAHHSSSSRKALDETSEFSKAVQKAVDMVKEDNTLIVVTSDHAHTMSYAGYAQRGSNIFGYGGKASDNNPYTILNYANGPGYKIMDSGERYVPTEEEMNQVSFQWPSTSPLASETHGADDVAIFARGPWAHLFTGIMEQNVLPHLMAFASCTSPTVKCDNYVKET